MSSINNFASSSFESERVELTSLIARDCEGFCGTLRISVLATCKGKKAGQWHVGIITAMILIVQIFFVGDS